MAFQSIDSGLKKKQRQNKALLWWNFANNVTGLFEPKTF
jgi:hypothetical protein